VNSHHHLLCFAAILREHFLEYHIRVRHGVISNR